MALQSPFKLVFAESVCIFPLAYVEYIDTDKPVSAAAICGECFCGEVICGEE